MANLQTDAELGQQAREILKRPYRMVIRGDDDEGYLAEAPELPGCFTAGESPGEALAMLQEAMELWIETALAEGIPIPEPQADSESEGSHSGRVLVRMPKTLHRLLAERARAEGVSLNQYAVAVLAKGLG